MGATCSTTSTVVEDFSRESSLEYSEVNAVTVPLEYTPPTNPLDPTYLMTHSAKHTVTTCPSCGQTTLKKNLRSAHDPDADCTNLSLDHLCCTQCIASLGVKCVGCEVARLVESVREDGISDRAFQLWTQVELACRAVPWKLRCAVHRVASSPVVLAWLRDAEEKARANSSFIIFPQQGASLIFRIGAALKGDNESPTDVFATWSQAASLCLFSCPIQDESATKLTASSALRRMRLCNLYCRIAASYLLASQSTGLPGVNSLSDTLSTIVRMSIRPSTTAATVLRLSPAGEVTVELDYSPTMVHVEHASTTVPELCQAAMVALPPIMFA